MPACCCRCCWWALQWLQVVIVCLSRAEMQASLFLSPSSGRMDGKQVSCRLHDMNYFWIFRFWNRTWGISRVCSHVSVLLIFSYLAFSNSCFCSAYFFMVLNPKSWQLPYVLIMLPFFFFSFVYFADSELTSWAGSGLYSGCLWIMESSMKMTNRFSGIFLRCYFLSVSYFLALIGSFLPVFWSFSNRLQV